MLVRIFRHFVPGSVVLLALFELTLITVAWFLGLSDFQWTRITLVHVLQSPTLRLAALAGATMGIAGLYQSKALLDFRVMAVHLLVGFVFMTPILIIGILYWRNVLAPEVSLSTLYLKATLSWLLCILITRAGFMALVDLKIFKARVVVLGTGRRAVQIADLVASGQNQYFIPVAYVGTCNDKVLIRPDVTEICDENADALAHFSSTHGATEIVVATDDRRGLPVLHLLHCRLAGIRVIDYLDFLERETKSVNLDALQPAWLIYSDGFRCSTIGKHSKRCLDVLMSLGVLLLVFPLLALTALAIKLDSSGPVLYRQRRVGLGGRPFSLIKFRSMQTDAEKDCGPRWAMAKDPRVTRVGSVMRKFRIDELPQLINVLRGEMSFVGPRPERPEFVAELAAQIPYYRERHCVKPGITGWAQVSYDYGGSAEGARRKLAYDLYYLKNHGFFLDLVIILQTLRVIFCADGAR